MNRGLVGAVFLAAFGIAQAEELVYSARYYKQGKAKSEFQLYMCRHDGTHRRQITSGPNLHDSPLWLDRNHLAFVETIGRMPIESWDESNTWVKNLIVRDMRTQRDRILLSYRVHNPWEGEFFGGAFHLGQGWWKVTADRATPTTEPPSPPEHELNSDGPEQSVSIPSGSVSKPFLLEWKHEFTADSPQPTRLLIDGNPFTATLQKLGQTYVVGGDTLFFVATPDFLKFYQGELLYRYRRSTKQLQQIVGPIGQLGFSPDRPIYYGCQTEGRPLRKLRDGRQLWCHDLYSGNWHTGQKWVIAQGLVSVGEHTVRPAR